MTAAGRIRDRILARKAARDEKERLWRGKCLAALATFPILVLEMGSMAGEGAFPTPPPLARWLLVTAALAVLAPPFYAKGLPDLARGRFKMDALVSLGSLVAYLHASWELARGRTHHLHFEDALAILAFLTAGRYLEARARARAAASVEGLIDLEAPTARVLRDGREVEVAAESVAVGEEVRVRPGEKIPVDGAVVEGAAEADERLLTGEPALVAKTPGARVLAGSILSGGALLVRADRTGEETTLAGILVETERIGEGRTAAQDLADRVIGVFLPAVMGVAGITFFGWLIATGSFGAAIRPTVAVLVIACPCALGIAIPVAVSVGAGALARRGVLLREIAATDRIPGIRTALLDKTGTLTTGNLRLADLRLAGIGEGEAVRLAATVESRSEHPIGRALAAAWAARVPRTGAAPEAVEEFRASPGEGVSARVGRWTVRVGRPAWCGAAPTGEDAAWCAERAGRGLTVFAASYAGYGAQAARAWFALEDEYRPEARAVAADLRARGLHTILLSGDRVEAAERAARDLGLDAARGGVLPSEKAAVVRELRARGGVLFVGDGVNDGPALAEADLGVAMGGGAGLAAVAGAAVLTRDDLRGVPVLLDVGEALRRKARQNLFWAFAYNAVLIPAAALGVAPPTAAAAAMALSDLTVIANAMRLWRFARPR